MKPYSVYGKVRGKKAYEETPSVQVWADSPEQAQERGGLIIKNHPIYNQHFEDDVHTEEDSD